MTAQTVVPPGDVRHSQPVSPPWFQDGSPDPAFLARRDAVRDIPTSDGRTLAQVALAWIWHAVRSSSPAAAMSLRSSRTARP